MVEGVDPVPDWRPDLAHPAVRPLDVLGRLVDVRLLLYTVGEIDAINYKGEVCHLSESHFLRPG